MGEPELEPEKRNRSKLGQAMQDAAIANINEDIHDIHTTLASIVTELPVRVQSELANLREEITCLEKALKIVPDEFDSSFQKKINRVLDITAEVEAHTGQLERTLRKDIGNAISSDLKTLLDNHDAEFKKTLASNFLISKGGLLLYGVISLIIGAAFLFGAFYIANTFF